MVKEVVASGIHDIIIATGRHKRSLEYHFDKYYELKYTLQKAGRDRELRQIRKITALADLDYSSKRILEMQSVRRNTSVESLSQSFWAIPLQEA